MPDYFSQAVNFHFYVDFGFGGNDVMFQSVTGLDATIETETIKEGGENRFSHVIPLRRRYGPLVLKRGILRPDQSDMTKWLQDAFQHERIKPIPLVNIYLQNEDHNTSLMYWTLSNVWPISWKVGELNAEQGAILIETLELNYNVLLINADIEKGDSRSVEAARANVE